MMKQLLLVFLYGLVRHGPQQRICDYWSRFLETGFSCNLHPTNIKEIKEWKIKITEKRKDTNHVHCKLLGICSKTKLCINKLTVHSMRVLRIIAWMSYVMSCEAMLSRTLFIPCKYRLKILLPATSTDNECEVFSETPSWSHWLCKLIANCSSWKPTSATENRSTIVNRRTFSKHKT